MSHVLSKHSMEAHTLGWNWLIMNGLNGSVAQTYAPTAARGIQRSTYRFDKTYLLVYIMLDNEKSSGEAHFLYQYSPRTVPLTIQCMGYIYILGDQRTDVLLSPLSANSKHEGM